MNFCSVQDVREHFKNLETTSVTEDMIQLNSLQVIKNRIAELRDLQQSLVASEMGFYKAMGLDTSDMKLSLLQLQYKILDWNSSGASSLLDTDVNSLILEIGELFQVDLDKLREAFKDKLVRDKMFSNYIVSDNIDQIGQLGASEVVKFFTAYKGMNIISHTVKESSIENVITDIQVIMGSDNKNHLTFNISEEVGTVSPSVKNRLALIYNNTAKELGYSDDKLLQVSPKNAEEFKNRLIEILINRIGDQEAASWIEREIRENFDRYGMTRNFFNYAVVKGFLGEVYWNACFRYLTGGKSGAVGTIKDEAGRSITIDMIFRNAGFQIKAYNLHDGDVTFGTHGQKRMAGTFTIERAQIRDAVGEALLYFFATMSFNQPIERAPETYHKLYKSEIDAGIKQANEIFDAYADRIIGLDKEFEAQLKGNKFFNGYGLYFNTFFLVNKYIVPGSAIVQAIIDSINKTLLGDPNMLFEASYSIEASEKWSPKHKVPSKNLVQLADQVKIIYSVTLNIPSLLNNAYDYII